MKLNFLKLTAVFFLTFVTGCSTDDDGDTSTPTPPQNTTPT